MVIEVTKEMDALVYPIIKKTLTKEQIDKILAAKNKNLTKLSQNLLISKGTWKVMWSLLSGSDLVKL